MEKIITFISDTHSKHKKLTNDLIGGDYLIHGGDIMTNGYAPFEMIDFLEWFDGLNNYKNKIFIGGNHDRLIQNENDFFKSLLSEYKNIHYLQDEEMIFDCDSSDHKIKLYASPWQPEFFDWAFNLPRNGVELEKVWSKIPLDTDILITHSPPFGYLDKPYGHQMSVGCEILREVVDRNRPKIHIFGHIHGSHGYYYNGHTHFINASVLNEQYNYTNSPLSIKWNPITNEIEWLS
jgi:Icc-related predicted phosphoesterase